MKKSIRLHLTGTVQGIFFRQFIKDSADKLNVKGYVRNLEDGRIEIFLEGDKEKVDSMILVCKAGPKHATIRNIEEKPEPFQEFKEFKILRF
ncbi:MAG: acylphosphatase [Nanoarchaeota archaeon]|nr:acylphosphatase [Nanoarchaeota archaeon]